MGLHLFASGEGKSLDLHVTHNLCPLAKELGVYEAMWGGELFSPATIATPRGDRSVLAVCDRHLALINQAIARIETGDFSTPDPANGWGFSESFLGALQEIKAFCDGNEIIFGFHASK